MFFVFRASNVQGYFQREALEGISKLLSPEEVVQLLNSWLEKSCNTLPLAGGSDAVAAGEGFSRSDTSKLPAIRIAPLLAVVRLSQRESD